MVRIRSNMIRIEQVHAMNLSLGRDTTRLKESRKNPKSMCNYSEVTLERIFYWHEVIPRNRIVLVEGESNHVGFWGDMAAITVAFSSMSSATINVSCTCRPSPDPRGVIQQSTGGSFQRVPWTGGASSMELCVVLASALLTDLRIFMLVWHRTGLPLSLKWCPSHSVTACPQRWDARPENPGPVAGSML